jgi:HAD superfamily hydrolase (TIGR01548 family)
VKGVLVFDMDGVLVDVTESYRETIQQTVERFTGSRPARSAIQDLKNQGGFNDDWKLSYHLISQSGARPGFQEVVEHFQRIFHGSNGDGLILRERWMDRTGVLERLSRAYRLAVFTGRMKWEAEVTLRRFAPELTFEPIIGMNEVKNLKPSPEGLLCARDLCGGAAAWYIGDTVDDARCARAAGVPFIGIAAPANPRHGELCRLLGEEGALAVLDDINGLESVLPA